MSKGYDYSKQQKKTYEWYKAHGICVACKKREAARGHSLCPDCMEERRDRYQKKKALMTEDERKERNARSNEHTRAGRARRKRDHRCLNCGKPAKDGDIYCYECGLRVRRKKKEAMRKYRMAHPEYEPRVKTDFSPGLCSRCNEPALPGFKLCKRHYKATLKGLEIGRPHSPFAKMNHRTFLKGDTRK